MAEVHRLLKRVFIIFNIIFAITGAVTIILALLCHVKVGNTDKLVLKGILSSYFMGVAMMVIAILGACGAHRGIKLPLTIFLACMVVSGLLMLGVGIPMARGRSQVMDTLEMTFRSEVPLDQASPETQDATNSFQSELHCCGWFNYSDWSGNIPDSCLCSQEKQEVDVVCQTVSYKSNQTRSIYAEPCFPLVIFTYNMLFDIGLGVIFSLLVLAFFGVILSSIIICQMSQPDKPPTAAPAVAFAASSKYQEVHNPQTD